MIFCLSKIETTADVRLHLAPDQNRVDLSVGNLAVNFDLFLLLTGSILTPKEIENVLPTLSQ